MKADTIKTLERFRKMQAGIRALSALDDELEELCSKLETFISLADMPPDTMQADADELVVLIRKVSDSFTATFDALTASFASGNRKQRRRIGKH